MGKIKPILNLSWAMATPVVHRTADTKAETINARLLVKGVSKGKEKGLLLGGMQRAVL
jgi:hypothetical protein